MLCKPKMGSVSSYMDMFYVGSVDYPKKKLMQLLIWNLKLDKKVSYKLNRSSVLLSSSTITFIDNNKLDKFSE